MLLLLVACVKPTAPPETGAPVDSGEVAGLDTAPPPGPGPCGTWAGVRRVGSRWAFRPTADYIARFGWTGTGTTSVTALAGDTVTLHTVANYAGDEGSFAVDRVETWRCDSAGAWWTRSEAATTFTTGGQAYTTGGTRTFEPGWLVRPAALPVEDAWVDHFTLTLAVTGQAPQVTPVDCTSTAAADEVLHLPAGDQSARRVDTDCIGANGGTTWLAEGQGLVADEDLEVVKYEP